MTQHDLWPLPPAQEGFDKMLTDLQEARRAHTRRQLRQFGRDLVAFAIVLTVTAACIAILAAVALALFFLFTVTVGTL